MLSRREARQKTLNKEYIMSTIGKIMQSQKEGKIHLHGHISTLQFNLTFWLEENRFSSNDRAPHYLVMCRSPQGAIAQVGAVWKKTTQKLSQGISEFFSITMDDPSFPHPLNVAAFPNNEGGWDITYRRRQEAVTA